MLNTVTKNIINLKNEDKLEVMKVLQTVLDVSRGLEPSNVIDALNSILVTAMICSKRNEPGFKNPFEVKK